LKVSTSLLGSAGTWNKPARNAPVLAVELDHRAAGEAGQIGREVISRRGPQRPIGEIGARIVRIGISVEDIADREAASGDGDAVDVALAAELIGGVLDGFLLAAEPEGLAEEVTLRAEPGVGRAALLGLAIGKSGQPQRAI
jgi:hypothetical protein